MKCSALGLEPGSVDGLGRAYILPFRNHGKLTATFILGYKGMLDLARRSGELKDISARAVYEGDEFEYEFGLDEKLRHVPSTRKREKGERPTHVYMVAHFKDGGHYMDVMTADEVEAVRKRSKSKDNGPWVTDYEAMAKKSVIRRAFPYLPVSVEAQQAAAADETTPDYSGVLSPIIPESDAEASAEAPIDVPVDVEPQEGESPLRKAVCKSCGNVIEVAQDASPEDLGEISCCGKPDYGWEQ
jgi:recombination protein RecT